MAHGSIREFDPTKESVEDFYKHFEFYCVANNIRPGKGDNRNKALFLTSLGQTTFAKLKVLASPTIVGQRGHIGMSHWTFSPQDD